MESRAPIGGGHDARRDRHAQLLVIKVRYGRRERQAGQ
jgi:hypothetical protein